MRIIDKIKDSRLGDLFNKEYKAFCEQKNVVKVKVMKGDRREEYALVDNENYILTFYKEVKNINVTDVIIDERNHKYLVKKVEIDRPFELVVDGKKKTIYVVKITCEFNYPDTNSLVYKTSQYTNFNQNQSVIINATNSEISDIGKIYATITQNQDINSIWNDLEHDLDYRFDSDKYKKIRDNINDSLEKKDVNVFNKDLAIKTAEIIGGFIGQLLGNFIVSLVAHMK